MAAKKTGPLARLSVDDTCSLIDLIHGHDVLWDLRHPQYRISTIKNATWTAVRVVFQERTGIVCEDQHVIAKFEALRSSFSRELRKLKESKKSGAGAEDVRKVTWPYFNQMMFLRGSVSLDNYVTSNMVNLATC
ncbi:hypothetical protein BaRGS_00038599 [Batillaria attramentaria]|uniref:MADF domain-containing protein n=1 Tax=Batillaria attramentaria TaxID=370345 RepID=A0ABD0J5T4_9CAEN